MARGAFNSGHDPVYWPNSDELFLDLSEMRERVQIVLSRIVDDSKKGASTLDTHALVDSAEREVVATARLVIARDDQPGLYADALHERSGLIDGCHGHRKRNWLATTCVRPTAIGLQS